MIYNVNYNIFGDFMRSRPKKDLKDTVSITLRRSLIAKIDRFLDDDGLKDDKVNRSTLIEDLLDYTFNDFEQKGKKSILEHLYPNE